MTHILDLPAFRLLFHCGCLIFIKASHTAQAGISKPFAQKAFQTQEIPTGPVLNSIQYRNDVKIQLMRQSQ
jgi:hypothetical protein